MDDHETYYRLQLMSGRRWPNFDHERLLVQRADMLGLDWTIGPLPPKELRGGVLKLCELHPSTPSPILEEKHTLSLALP
jgi:hypothetical protein